jgi:hypothetical protein
VLAEEVVDLLHGGAGAEGDALAAAAVNDGGVVALLGGHGVDDGLDAGELGLVDVGPTGLVGAGPRACSLNPTAALPHRTFFQTTSSLLRRS